MAEEMNEKTEAQAEVSPAEELRKAAEAAAETSEPAAAEGDAANASPEVQAALAKAAENFDLYLRSVAEMENVRRRCAEDVQKAHKFSIEKFAKNLLPVVDSMEKAIEAAAGADEKLREGLEATHRQFMHALEVSGMVPVNPAGEKFDPNTSQAIAMVPAAEGQVSGTVSQVFQCGWKLADRVIRPAMVSVAQ